MELEYSNTIKHKVNNILNVGYKDQLLTRLYRVVIATVVVIDLLIVIMHSFNEFDRFTNLFLAFFYFSGVVFLVDYGLRLWTAPLHHSGKKIPVLDYVASFFGLIDFVVIIPFIVPLLFPGQHELIRLTDLLCIFLIFKLSRHSRSFSIIGAVFRSARTGLFIALSVGLIIVTCSAVLMYYVERQAQPEVFDSLGEGFWWAIITFTTVGYGDIYPITALGKILASFVALVGIGMIALPTGIISSSFMTQMTEFKRQEHSVDVKSNGAYQNVKYKFCPHCGKKIE